MKKYILAVAIAICALMGPAMGDANAQGYFYRGGPTVVDRLMGNGNPYGMYGGYGNYYGNRWGYNRNLLNYGNYGYGHMRCNNWRYHHHRW